MMLHSVFVVDFSFLSLSCFCPSSKMILFSETMLQMWTDFARFGDPNGDPQRVSEKVTKLRTFLTKREIP